MRPSSLGSGARPNARHLRRGQLNGTSGHLGSSCAQVARIARRSQRLGVCPRQLRTGASFVTTRRTLGHHASQGIAGFVSILRVDRVRNTHVGVWLFERAYWAYKRVVEAHGVAALSGYVEPDSVIIDVGANLGFFSRLFVGFSQQPRVIAIEPERRNLASLRRGAMKWGDGRVLVVSAAAADIDGMLNLRVDRHNHADHQLSKDGVATTAVRLDTLVAELSLTSVSLIKIDVQGAEERVLRGALGLLRRDHPTVFIELDPGRLAKQGSCPEAVVGILTDAGYDLYLGGRTGFSKMTEDDVLSAVESDGYIDVLAVWGSRHSPTL